MENRALALCLILLVAGCTSGPENRPPLVTTPPGETGAVARRPLETPAIPPTALAPPPALPAPAPPPTKTVVPPGTLYVCVTSSKGQPQQTAIEYTPKVGKLCSKHPEMGPCQYERNNCRASGGRVFAANGSEITTATETEYDKKVMRVRFRAN